LDELIALVVAAVEEIRRMIHDLANDDRANFGIGVSGAEGARAQRDEIDALAGRKAALRNAVCGWPKFRTGAIAGEIAARISDREINVVAVGGAEGERNAGVGVELMLVKNQ